MLFSERGRGESVMSASDCRVVGESAAERTGGPVENAGLMRFFGLHSQSRNVQTAGELAHLSLRECAALFDSFFDSGENEFFE